MQVVYDFINVNEFTQTISTIPALNIMVLNTQT